MQKVKQLTSKSLNRSKTNSNFEFACDNYHSV